MSLTYPNQPSGGDGEPPDRWWNAAIPALMTLLTGPREPWVRLVILALIVAVVWRWPL